MMFDGLGSTSFVKIFMRPKGISDDRWSMIGCRQSSMRFGKSMTEIIFFNGILMA
jgi:hypothetical protein